MANGQVTDGAAASANWTTLPASGCVVIRPHSALGYRPPAPEAVLWPAWLSPRPTAGDRADVVYH